MSTVRLTFKSWSDCNWKTAARMVLKQVCHRTDEPTEKEVDAYAETLKKANPDSRNPFNKTESAPTPREAKRESLLDFQILEVSLKNGFGAIEDAEYVEDIEIPTACPASLPTPAVISVQPEQEKITTAVPINAEIPIREYFSNPISVSRRPIENIREEAKPALSAPTIKTENKVPQRPPVQKSAPVKAPVNALDKAADILRRK